MQPETRRTLATVILCIIGSTLLIACHQESHDPAAPLPAKSGSEERDNAALWYWPAIIADENWSELSDDELDALLEDRTGLEGGASTRMVIDDALVLRSLQRAAASESCRFAMDRSRGIGVWLPHMKGMRRLIKQLCFDARLKLREGKGDAAVERLAIAVRMCRDIGTDRTVLSSHIAAEAFATVSDEIQAAIDVGDGAMANLDALRHALEQIDSSNPFRLREVAAFEHELSFEWLMRECANGRCKEAVTTVLGEMPKLRQPPYRELTTGEFRDHVQQYGEFLGQVDEALQIESHSALDERLATLDKELADGKHGAIAPLLGVPFDRVAKQLTFTQERLAELARRVRSTDD